MNKVLMEANLPGGHILQMVEGDLTQESVDAIVNAANSQLQHGGGVAGAIARRGGPQIQAESSAWVREHGPVSHAEPAITHAGSLPSRYVIHAVGPIWGEGDEGAKLTAAVNGSLSTAERMKLTSIAIPAISTGIFGFPKERAARILIGTIQAYFKQKPGSGLKKVRLTLYDKPTIQAFRQAWEEKIEKPGQATNE
ncbi:MAG: macro domain-containing protein [Anaerolineales bacterium]|jgi:O-acetyl-ADP-ribose deacetylase (regulator of RNase III)